MLGLVVCAAKPIGPENKHTNQSTIDFRTNFIGARLAHESFSPS
jgi:hypothetical protein